MFQRAVVLPYFLWNFGYFEQFASFVYIKNDRYKNISEYKDGIMFDECTFSFDLISTETGKIKEIKGTKLLPDYFDEKRDGRMKYFFFASTLAQALMIFMYIITCRDGYSKDVKALGNSWIQGTLSFIGYVVDFFLLTLVYLLQYDTFTFHKRFWIYLDNLLKIQNYNCKQLECDQMYNCIVSHDKIDIIVLKDKSYKRLNNVIVGPLDMLEIKNVRNLMTLRRCAFQIMTKQAVPIQRIFIWILFIFLIQDYVLIDSLMDKPNWAGFFHSRNLPSQITGYLIISFIFYTLITLILFFAIFFYAYKINGFYESQEEIFQTQKCHLSMIRQLHDYYFDFSTKGKPKAKQRHLQVFRPDSQKSYEQTFHYLNASDNRQISYVVKHMVNNFGSHEKIDKHFDYLIAMYESALADLAQDKLKWKLKFLGLFEISKQSLTGVAGLLGFYGFKNLSKLWSKL